MADELFALSTIPPEAPAEADYDVLCAAMMETARGRWFLQEYARRNRHADTERLIEAIARIESVVRRDRAELAVQGMRLNLLDMARAIAQAHTETAEIKPDVAGNGKPAEEMPDIVAAAERLQDVAWAMRERGLEPATCDQIEAIARTVRSASVLHDPSDRRARRLGEALHDLARRIDALLDAGAAGVTEPAAIAPTGEGAAARLDNGGEPVEGAGVPIEGAFAHDAPAERHDVEQTAPHIETEHAVAERNDLPDEAPPAEGEGIAPRLASDEAAANDAAPQPPHVEQGAETSQGAAFLLVPLHSDYDSLVGGSRADAGSG